MAAGWRRSGGRLACIVALCAAPVARGAAQEPDNGSATRNAPAVVRLGKWGAAALFLGFTATGISRHNGADADYRSLTGYCKVGGGSCLLAPDGTYLDPHSEQLYQQVIAGDKAARAWLIGGQVALAGAAALFIMQLSYEHGPHNIPFEPQFSVMPGRGTLVGLRVPLGGRGARR